MTIPEERTRALVWAGGFLVELARDSTLPLAVRRRAVIIARHFPTIEQVSFSAMLEDLEVFKAEYTNGQFDPGLGEGMKFGPLKYSTRLAWPEVPIPKRKPNPRVAKTR